MNNDINKNSSWDDWFKNEETVTPDFMTDREQSIYTLEDLLKMSPKGSFIKTDDDKEWLEIPSVGKEYK